MAEDLVADLAQRRVSLGLSQREVAERMGSSQPSVARLEGAGSDPRLSTVVRYADAVRARLVVRAGTTPQDGAVLLDGADAAMWSLRHGLALVVPGVSSAGSSLVGRAASVLAVRGPVHVVDLLGSAPGLPDATVTRVDPSDLAPAHAILRDHDPRRPGATTAAVLFVLGLQHLDPIGLRQVQLAARGRPVLATLSQPSALTGFELLADTAELIAAVAVAGTVERARLAGAMAVHAGVSPDEVHGALSRMGAADAAIAAGGRMVVGTVVEAAPAAVVPARPGVSAPMASASGLAAPDAAERVERPGQPPRPAAARARGASDRHGRTAFRRTAASPAPARAPVVVAGEPAAASEVARRIGPSVAHTTVGGAAAAGTVVTAPMDPDVLDRLLTPGAVLLVAVGGAPGAALAATTLVDGLRRRPRWRAAVALGGADDLEVEGLDVVGLGEVAAYADRPSPPEEGQ